MSDRLVDITGGYGNVYKEVMKKNNLSIEAKAIYSYLSSYAGSNDIAFPSVSLICHELNISENRFRKYKDELINNGIISIKEIEQIMDLVKISIQLIIISYHVNL